MQGESDVEVRKPDYSWIRKLGLYSREEQDAWIKYFEEGDGMDKEMRKEVNGPKVPYYQFPGGVEVRDISAHLTSFGGQALQYLARSCRLDGGNKGEQVQDLKKARDLITWEIERLEGS